MEDPGTSVSLREEYLKKGGGKGNRGVVEVDWDLP